MLSYAFTTIFMCFLLLMRNSLCQLCILEFRLVWLSFSCCILFSSVSLYVDLFFCLSNSLQLCLFYMFVPCCSAAESFALDLRHICIRSIFVGRVVLPRILISAALRTLFSTIVVIKVGGRLFWLFGLCVCFFHSAFWKILAVAFAFSVVGSKGTPILVALALVLLMLPNRLLLILAPFYVHFHLVCRELSVLCSFSSHLLCN